MAVMLVKRAAEKYGLNSDLIHSARHSGEIPEWMEKRGTRWFVDDELNSFQLFIKSKIKHSSAAKRGHKNHDRNQEMEKSKDKVLSLTETERLQELSIQADLSQPIIKLRLQKYKIEAEKLQLERNAGNLISRELSEFLYTGYLDRLNREMLQYANKIEANVELLLNEMQMKLKAGEEVDSHEESKKVTLMIRNETEEIIREVKNAQKKNLKEWAKDEGMKI